MSARPTPRGRKLHRVEESARLVARAVRHAVDTGPFSAAQAVEVAWMQLSRPTGPKERIPVGRQADLRAALVTLSAALDVTQPRSILAFSRAAAEAAWALLPRRRHPGACLPDAVEDGPRALAQAAVYAEASRARDPEDHVRRAVTRALREARRDRGLTRLPLDDDDPLRALLDVAPRGKVLLPKHDLRKHLAAAAAGTPLGGLLRLAARFSDELLRPAMGEELWALCRPVGFSDKAETRVLVEVRSSTAAQETQLRSAELLHRLRGVPGFSRLQGLRLLVAPPRALPAVGVTGPLGAPRRPPR